MFEKHAHGKPMEAGIISFKNLKSGFLPFLVKNGKDVNSTIDAAVLDQYIEQLVILINEILDVTIPFEEKV